MNRNVEIMKANKGSYIIVHDHSIYISDPTWN